MTRLIVSATAFVAALILGIGTVAPATAGARIPTDAALVSTNDNSSVPVQSDADVTDRGSPELTYDYAASRLAVDASSNGTSARPQAVAILTDTTYHSAGGFAQFDRGKATTRTAVDGRRRDLRSASGARCAAEAGPGAWGTAAESMSSRAAAYQARVTGGAAGSVYRVGGVKFDGFANGVLQEAKGPGYAAFVRNGQFQPWFRGSQALVDQAERQLAAAGGTPITWSVAEEPVVGAINSLFARNGISGINVTYVP